MATKSAFISFDYDHDNDLRGNLIAQANKSGSPFSITDWSVKEPFDEKWREKVRKGGLAVRQESWQEIESESLSLGKAVTTRRGPESRVVIRKDRR